MKPATKMKSFSVFLMQFYLILSLTLSILEVSPEYFCAPSPPISAAAAANTLLLPFEVTNPPTSHSRVQEKKEGFCTDQPILNTGYNVQPLYPKVANPTFSPSHLHDLLGFTRNVYKKDHAWITPEGQVFSLLPYWTKTLGAYLITPAMGSHFVMYLAKMQENSKSGIPPSGVERFVFVVNGTAIIGAHGSSHSLYSNSYAYFSPNSTDYLECEASATLVVFERSYSYPKYYGKKLIFNSTDKQPLVETPGELFELRKLLPTSREYDFNIHVMDFQPGEFLNVKEFHHNQHGFLLLDGQGIYLIGDRWYYVQAGDAIWMAPYVPQSYAALGKSRHLFCCTRMFGIQYNRMYKYPGCFMIRFQDYMSIYKVYY